MLRTYITNKLQIVTSELCKNDSRSTEKMGEQKEININQLRIDLNNDLDKKKYEIAKDYEKQVEEMLKQLNERFDNQTKKNIKKVLKNNKSIYNSSRHEIYKIIEEHFSSACSLFKNKDLLSKVDAINKLLQNFQKEMNGSFTKYRKLSTANVVEIASEMYSFLNRIIELNKEFDKYRNEQKNQYQEEINSRINDATKNNGTFIDGVDSTQVSNIKKNLTTKNEKIHDELFNKGNYELIDGLNYKFCKQDKSGKREEEEEIPFVSKIIGCIFIVIIGGSLMIICVTPIIWLAKKSLKLLLGDLITKKDQEQQKQATPIPPSTPPSMPPSTPSSMPPSTPSSTPPAMAAAAA